MNSNIEFAEAFKKRTKKFIVEIIKFCRKLPKSRETFIITDQLIRCSTSVGSNYRAACRARSGKEFYSKLCIVVEEADESVYWLEIIEAINIAEDDVNDLIIEGTEILSIVATSRKTAGNKL